MWNYISIPGPLKKEDWSLPSTARKKRGKAPSRLHSATGHRLQRGRPTKEYLKKKLRAKLYARAKVRDAAGDDPHLLLDTARVTAKGVDDDVSFVIKQMHQDPTLAAYLKKQIIQRKKGLGRYLLCSAFSRTDC